MKKSAFIIALLFASFLGFGQNEMPYYIMYQMQGDTVYRNLQSVGGIHIDSTGQQLTHNNGTDLIPISGLDTVYMFRDKFRKYVGEMADWDEVLFSMEQIHFYKENSNGQPSVLFSFYMNDSIPDGYFIYTEFDEAGNPEFTNINDSCVMIVSDVDGEYYNAVVIDRGMASYTLDSVQIPEAYTRIYGLRAWQDLTPAQQAVVTRQGYMGGLSMVMGGATIAVGCAMLVPGVNVVVGATIALGGAATFVSGALLTTRAADQMISDGTHTEGFEASSRLFGLVGAVASGAQGGTSLAANLVYYAVTEGGGYLADNMLLERENEALNAASNRAQQIRSMELSATGRATLLDMESHSVRLFGQVSQKLDPNDRFGIMISRDQEALTVEDCQLLEASHPIGAFSCDFSGLEPCGGYYYRSYYYSTELASFGSQFSPWVVSTKKSFKMPGVKTLGHEQSGFSFSYDLYGEFQDVANQPSHTVGFCYSYTNTTPTFDDHITQKTVSNNGEFSDHVFLDSDFTRCYYRAYAFINGEIAYGEVRQIGVEVTTYMAENVTATTATCWGEVVCEECEVTERGICWSTSHNPTTSGSHINEGQGTGFYSCSLTGLTPGTTYYARAYAIVGSRTLYGNEVSFTTLTIPTVTTAQVTNITQTTATGGGTVTDEGSSPVTMRGLCWSTSHNPTTSSSHATSGTGTGSFTVSMTGLTQGTTYYVRAYATNEAGTAYGNEVTFTTQEDEPNPDDWVDLGLPSGLLWATRNVGASSPEDYGSYFAWGETSPKSYYSWDTYAYGYYDDYGYLHIIKYNPSHNYFGPVDNLTILLPEDDAATANYGGRMPTIGEWVELYTNCTSVWTTSGIRFTGSNGNTLFLPAAGIRWDDNHTVAGIIGCYMSSNLNTAPNYVDDAWYFTFYLDWYYEKSEYGGRNDGLSVRAVREN